MTVASVERSARRISDHLRDRRWTLASVGVRRQWDVQVGRTRPRVLAHAMSLDGHRWVLSLTIEARTSRSTLAEVRRSSWLREIHERLGDGWLIEKQRVAGSIRLVRLVRGATGAGVLGALDRVVTAVDARTRRRRASTPRANPMLAVLESSRARGWDLESVGWERRRRVGRWTIVSRVTTITRGLKDRSWFTTLVQMESSRSASTTERHAHEVRDLLARGYERVEDGIFLRGKPGLDLRAAKREIALLEGRAGSGRLAFARGA